MTSAGLVNLGFENALVADRVVAVVSPDAAPIRRLKEEARRHNKLIDATNGRRTRAVVVTDSDHIVLTSLQPLTLIQRLQDMRGTHAT